MAQLAHLYNTLSNNKIQRSAKSAMALLIKTVDYPTTLRSESGSKGKGGGYHPPVMDKNHKNPSCVHMPKGSCISPESSPIEASFMADAPAALHS